MITPKLSPIAKSVLEARYLDRDKDNTLIETPELRFERVAKHIAQADERYNGDPETVWPTFYTMMAKRDFMPNTPCLANAGKPNSLGQLSACFVLPVPDSMDGIMTTLHDMAMIHKSGGGTGFSFSRIRPTGDFVKSTNGVASGPVSFMSIYNYITSTVKQGGIRAGANMGVLRVDHPNIMEFIDCKQDVEKIKNFNISIGVTNEFMRALEEDDYYELVNPRTGYKVGSLLAKDVFDKIVKNAHTTGEPGLVFLDRVNEHDPLSSVLGEIEATNPCGEVPLRPYDACVAKDTLVYTDSGVYEIGQLFVMQQDGKQLPKAVSMTPTGQVIHQPIAKVLKQGVKKTVKVVFNNHTELTCTPDHKLMMEDGWVEAKDSLGSKIRIPDVASRTPTVNEELNQDILKYEMFGWLVGDGSLTDKVCGVVFGFDDIEAQNRIELAFRDFADAHGVQVQQRPECSVNQIYSSSNASRQKFLDVGFKPASATEKEIPSCVWTAQPECQAAFLRGLFSANGTVALPKGRSNTNIRFCSSSPKLVSQVQQLLMYLGIYSVQNWHHFKNEDRNSQCQLLITESCVDRYKDIIGFNMSRKTERLYARTPGHKRGHPKFVEVIDIIELNDEEEVYDLAMPVHHNFVANGTVVHNCTLGSINLANFYVVDKDKPTIDFTRLGETVKHCVHFLDNVLDMNEYPVDEVYKVTKASRKIGLGVMGWADLLIKLGIPYVADEACNLATEVMRFINNTAVEASEELAVERGPFPLFNKSNWFHLGKKPRRNSTVTVIAPTGSISVIAGCSSGIEPLFALQITRNQAGMIMVDLNPEFVACAKREGFYSEELMTEVKKTGSVLGNPNVPEFYQQLFMVANEISSEQHIKMQAAFQAHVEDAVSKTINMRNEAPVDAVDSAYRLAWKTGCKGITVYRDGCRPMQVLSSGSTPKIKAIPERRSISKTGLRRGVTVTRATAYGSAHVTINEHPEDKQPFELFIELGKSGSEVKAFTEALGRTCSLMLKSSTEPRKTLAAFADQLSNIGGGNEFGFGENRIVSAPDAISKAIYEYLELAGEQENRKQQRDICPDCKQATLAKGGGCSVCESCGYSKC